MTTTIKILLITLFLHFCTCLPEPSGAALGPYPDTGLEIESVSTDGPDMVGALVTVIFPNGTQENRTWEIITGDLAGAVGSGWSVTFFGQSTFPTDTQDLTENSLALWYINLLTPISWMIIDLHTGNSVWDIFRVNETSVSTENSGDGVPFTVFNSTSPVSLTHYYNGIPTIPDRQADLWYVLNIQFLSSFTGVITFQADTDSLTEIVPEVCLNLPEIGPSEVVYVPQLISDGSIPTFYTQNNETRLHLELRSLSARNRRFGFDFNLATYISFGKSLQDPPNCQIPWTYMRTSENGTCYDLYLLDWALNDLINSCNVTRTIDSSGKPIIEGVIYIRTLTDRYIERSSGYNYTVVSQEFSEQGFMVGLSSSVISVTTEINEYAPIEISSPIIYDYEITLGNQPKSFYIRTLIQNPRLQGFRLRYDWNTSPVRQAAVNGASYPTPELGLIDAVFIPLTNGCITENGLCVQNWLLTLTPDYTVCRFTNVYYLLPFIVECVDPDPVLCPLNSNMTSTLLTVHIDTGSFCPFIIGNNTYTASLVVYNQDFTKVQSSFFVNQKVGFELTIDDKSGNIPDLAQLELTYLASTLDSSISSLLLFPPAVYNLNNSNVHVLIGGSSSTDGIEAAIEPNVCDIFGCANNVLKFRFTLSSSLWNVPPDQLLTLKVVLTVDVRLNSKKYIFDGSAKALSAGGNLVVSKPDDQDSGSAKGFIGTFLVLFSLFVAVFI